MSKIEVNRQEYVLMCIDIMKMPVEDNTLREYAEAELLRLIGEQWIVKVAEAMFQMERTIGTIVRGVLTI